MLGFDKGFQVVETGAPENAVLLDPRVDGAKRFRVELVYAMAAFAVLTDEVGATQQAQVLRDRGAGHGEGAGDLSGRLAAAAEQVEDGSAGGIGQGLESGLGGFGRRICNRTVTHNA